MTFLINSHRGGYSRGLYSFLLWPPWVHLWLSPFLEHTCNCLIMLKGQCLFFLVSIKTAKNILVSMEIFKILYQSNSSGLLIKILLVHKIRIIHLWLWMAGMEMDCNLKKLANFILCILEKSLRTNNYSLFFLGEIISYFSPSALRVISCYKRVS